MKVMTVNNSTNVLFSAAFQGAFALNVRAALLDVAVVWVLFHSFLGEKKVFYSQMHSVHIGCVCAEVLQFKEKRGKVGMSEHHYND